MFFFTKRRNQSLCMQLKILSTTKKLTLCNIHAVCEYLLMQYLIVHLRHQVILELEKKNRFSLKTLRKKRARIRSFGRIVVSCSHRQLKIQTIYLGFFNIGTLTRVFLEIEIFQVGWIHNSNKYSTIDLKFQLCIQNYILYRSA